MTTEVKLPPYNYHAALNIIREEASHYKSSPVSAKGENFITPERIGLVIVGKAHVELSFGKGMGDYTTYGITVYDKYGKPCDLLSRAVFQTEQIGAYLRLIKTVTTFAD